MREKHLVTGFVDQGDTVDMQASTAMSGYQRYFYDTAADTSVIRAPR